VVANLLENGAQVDAMDKVRIDMYVGPMYRVALLSVIQLNFTQHILTLPLASTCAPFSNKCDKTLSCPRTAAQ
jgi:hypothetical protein